uniref:Fetuin-B isoform X2 n=1 Tax=Geotrypetes seraphini TaxID=260995 RepID=A0A6P8SAD8_GEOSA|nr:fetuin-B isoform X2 [Geotrypetes seraphini]
MKLLLLLACVQLCRSVSPPESPPEPVLLDASCNDSSVEMAAGLALNEFNSMRTEGYIFSMNRIASAHTQSVGKTGRVFYMSLDMLETKCHVLSKRSAKNCENRPMHEEVSGHCNMTYYLNKPQRVANLHGYSCAFLPVSREKVSKMCPDCPTASSPDAPIFLETATLTLEKFNQESNETHYFAILNVTKGSMQWVVGPSYFTEFTIMETMCTKDKPVTNVSECEPVKREFAHFGLCKGSIMKSPLKEYKSASCEIYEPERQEAEDDHGQKDDHPEHHRGKKGHGHTHHDRHGHHKHPHSSNSPHVQPVESVQVDEHSTEPSTASETAEALKVVTLPVIPKRPSFFTTVTTLPFPETQSESDQCPGEYKYPSPFLDRE